METQRKILRAWGTYDFSARTSSPHLFESVSDKELKGEYYTRRPPADLFSVTPNKNNLPHKWHYSLWKDQTNVSSVIYSIFIFSTGLSRGSILLSSGGKCKFIKLT